ncbi:YegP family protein [Desulfovibrio cuneatus]|uniref:YegP family protein n=1 Tax=Desulfovibrio cuneatus TaxID=159728 RepID=UPI000429D143|nr:DUF1508 domain-containing protein [Desulfovibrio cuneatus]
MDKQETLSVYIDNNGQWRWRVLAEDNRIIAGAENGYDSKADCLADAEANGFILEDALPLDAEAASPVYF